MDSPAAPNSGPAPAPAPAEHSVHNAAMPADPFTPAAPSAPASATASPNVKISRGHGAKYSTGNDEQDAETESTHASDSTYDPWPYSGESAVLDIFKERLKALGFDGAADGKRFMRDFEALVGRVHPDASDDDKRLLLVTSFTGREVNDWYEEVDLEDDLPYGRLKELVQQSFPGVSKRRLRIVERDAKME